MTLDAATLFLVLIGFCLMSGVALAIRWLRSSGEAHLAYWSASFLIGSVAILGLALRGFIPPWMSIIVANSLSLIAFGIAWNGIRVFGGRRPVWPVVAIAPILWLIACQVPAIYASQPYRTVVSSGLATALCCLLALEILRRDADRLPARVPMAMLCLLHGVATLIRASVAFNAGRTGDLQLDPLFISIGLLEPIFVLFGVMICGLGLTQQRREVALTRKAAVDGLTGLLNRGAFFDEGEQLIAGARGEGRMVALLVFDIDYFKDINDTFGHAVGDRTLIAFAEASRHVLRASDPVGRLGGEEFAALLVGVDKATGAAIAERIRAEFARRTAALDGVEVAATASAGVAVSAGAVATLDALLVRADEALYAAKRSGRDLVWQAAE